jgi:hypothetical protein
MNRDRRRVRLSSGIGIAALVTLSASAARGQDRVTPDKDSRDTRLEALEKKLADQEKEIQDLKKRTPDKSAKPGSDVPAPKAGVDMEQSPQDARFEWGYDDGFYVKGMFGGQPYQIRPAARLQLDYRVYAGAEAVKTDQFVLRRTRVGFNGTFGVFGFQFDVDPPRQAGTANGIPLGDFWFQYQGMDELKLRFGHYKTPFDLDDGMTSDLRIDMIERSMIGGSGNQTAPDYRPGAEVFGSVFNKMFSYWASIQGQNDSNSQTTFQPLYCTRLQADVAGLTIGAGAIFEKRVGLGTALQTSFPLDTPAQFRFFNGVGVRGWDRRVDVDSAYFFGPFWVKAGYLAAAQERHHVLANGASGKQLWTEGFWGDLGVLLWGPPSSVPKPHVMPFEGWQLMSLDTKRTLNDRWSGLEFVLRAEWVRSDDGDGKDTNGAFTPPSRTPNAANVDGNQAWATTVGLNFAPIENVKFMIDWVHLRIGDATTSERPGLHHNDEFLFRAQCEF